MKFPPAAPVDAASQQQRNDDPGIERPRLKYAGYSRIAEAFVYFKLWSVAHDFKRWNGGIMEYWIGRLESEYSDTPFFPSLFHHSHLPKFHYLAAESRAAGTFAGRKVCMKATRAVTSCGADFCQRRACCRRLESLAGSTGRRSSRVATPSSAGPRKPPWPPRLWQFRHCLYCTSSAPCNSSGERPLTY